MLVAYHRMCITTPDSALFVTIVLILKLTCDILWHQVMDDLYPQYNIFILSYFICLQYDSFANETINYFYDLSATFGGRLSEDGITVS